MLPPKDKRNISMLHCFVYVRLTTSILFVAIHCAPCVLPPVTGTDYETAIENLMGMGYTREECMRAMQASFNNPDRAAEYLMTVCLLWAWSREWMWSCYL